VIKEATLYEPAEEGKVLCRLCAHRCLIAESKFGVCSVRQNQGGKLMTLVYAEVIAVHIDPIEKKPLFHFLPGTTSFSMATAGCNFRCGFCQNWQISQAGKKKGALGGEALSPEDAVGLAKARGCRSISYTYTEPTIFFEYAGDTARLARAHGLSNVFVTNGYMTAEALEAARGWLDAANVDLKSFREETYHRVCGGHLQPVLDSIVLMKELGMWVEVTTLVVPGMNDGDDELAEIAGFLAGVDADLPWHVSRFHPDYRYTDAPATPLATLERALELGKKAGLRYIYLGNVAGQFEDTACPQCGQALIRRKGFSVSENKIRNSSCPQCGSGIAGIW
jgi:pyruvate formate lyase activating enzyme